jgi:hypothetical protein
MDCTLRGSTDTLSPPPLPRRAHGPESQAFAARSRIWSSWLTACASGRCPTPPRRRAGAAHCDGARWRGGPGRRWIHPRLRRSTTSVRNSASPPSGSRFTAAGLSRARPRHRRAPCLDDAGELHGAVRSRAGSVLPTGTTASAGGEPRCRMPPGRRARRGPPATVRLQRTTIQTFPMAPPATAQDRLARAVLGPPPGRRCGLWDGPPGMARLGWPAWDVGTDVARRGSRSSPSRG